MTAPSLLMQQLQAQFEQVALGGGDFDLTVVAAFVQRASRGRGPGWCVLVLTYDRLAFEIAVDPCTDDVAGFLAELMLLPECSPAPDGARPQGLVLH